MNRKYTAEMKKQTVIYYLESGKSQEETIVAIIFTKTRVCINKIGKELIDFMLSSFSCK